MDGGYGAGVRARPEADWAGHAGGGGDRAGDGVCYQRKRDFPAFSAMWDEALAELEAERLAVAAEATGSEPATRPLTRARRDGWTQQRQRAFVRALADTGSYGKAAAQVGISMTSVQRLRRGSPEFQAMCDKALIEGGTTIEEAAYARAVEGWEEPVLHNGKVVAHRRRFSDALAKTLLAQRAGGAGGGGGARCDHGYATDEEVNRLLLERLTALAAKTRAEDRRAREAWADDMRRKGWAP